jgi:hypothetical protein
MCPHGHTRIGMGNGKRGGGNAIVIFDRPPYCFCGAEMEQVTEIGVRPEDCQPPGDIAA